MKSSRVPRVRAAPFGANLGFSTDADRGRELSPEPTTIQSRLAGRHILAQRLLGQRSAQKMKRQTGCLQ
jgi:hypothetical protein